MSHFAKIDKDGIVQQVIVAEQDFINSGLIGDSFNWVQTSYNETFRGSFASIGDVYDKEKDIFRPVQPYPSWTFNTEELMWQPPTAMPDDDKMYTWNEDTTTWDEVTE